MSAIAAWGQRNNRWVAAAAATVAVLATLAMLVLAQANGTLAKSINDQGGLVVVFYVYLATGLVLVVRRPESPISWLLLGIGLLPAVGAAIQEYAQYALVVRPGLAGGMAAAWFGQWWWLVNLTAVFIYLPLLFPTGQLPSPRWRWLSHLTLFALVSLSVLGMLAPTYKGQTGYVVTNPLGQAWAGEDSAAAGAIFLVTGLCMLLTLVSMFVRFRRARGIERQQLKWFVFAGVLTIGLPLLELVGYAPPWTQGRLSDVALCLPPLAVGLAIARYRLYDIDRLISRTMTYALLTALLLGLYLIAVTALTAITAPVTGESPVAVAAATLLAAAAFGPARRWIQGVVDRRFNRARYDAARTIDAFRAHLRDELDLAAITTNMQGVVEQTVQPSRVAVWLRPEAAR